MTRFACIICYILSNFNLVRDWSSLDRLSEASSQLLPELAIDHNYRLKRLLAADSDRRTSALTVSPEAIFQIRVGNLFRYLRQRTAQRARLRAHALRINSHADKGGTVA